MGGSSVATSFVAILHFLFTGHTICISLGQKGSILCANNYLNVVNWSRIVFNTWRFYTLIPTSYDKLYG